MLRLRRLIAICALPTTLCLHGCQDAAAPVRRLSPSEFQSEVLDHHATVVVGFAGDTVEQQQELQQAEDLLRRHMDGRIPIVSVLSVPNDWTHSDRGIRQTPALVAYVNGEEVARLLTPIREPQVMGWLRELQSDGEERRIAASPAKDLVLTDEDFDTQLAGNETPVLVDFWATWCGPCKMIEPHLKLIGADYYGRLTIGKVNVDEERQTAGRFVERGIPLLVLFDKGREVDRMVGAAPPEKLRSWIDSHLDRPTPADAR